MTKRNTKLVVFSILAIIIVAIGLRLFFNPITKFPSFSTYTYNDSDKYTQASNGTVDNISNLDVHWVSGNVEIVSYNGNKLIFEEVSDAPIPVDDRMCYWKDGNTLKIQFTKSGLRVMKNSHKNLIVYVPKDLKINELNTKVVSADLNIKGINANKLDIETVSGEVSLNSVSARVCAYEGVSGTLVADNIGFISFDGEAVSGEIALNILPIYKAEKIDIETVSGDIALRIPSEFGFTLELDTVSGDITSYTEGSTISRNKIKHGDGLLEIDLETLSGDVTLK